MTTIHHLGAQAGSVVTPVVQVGGVVYVSGQVALDENGNPSGGGFGDQVRGAFVALSAALELAGASLRDVVKVGAYLSDPGQAAEFNVIYRTIMSAPFPARTTVVVEFGHPLVAFEVDAIAHLST